MKGVMLTGMELLLAGLVIVVSLVLAAWQERPATQQTPNRPHPRRR